MNQVFAEIDACSEWLDRERTNVQYTAEEWWIIDGMRNHLILAVQESGRKDPMIAILQGHVDHFKVGHRLLREYRNIVLSP